MLNTPANMRLLRRPDAVLFDWDNTLLDHDRHTLSVIEQMAREYSAPPYPTAQQINELWAKNQQECCDRYFPGHDPKTLNTEFHDRIHKMEITDVPLIPGARELLDALRAKGVRLAVVSNKPEGVLKKEVAFLGMTDYFDVLRGDRGDNVVKPDPMMIIQTLQEMKIPHGNNWFVGDMMTDVTAARSDGFQRFIVGTRHRHKSEVLSYGADPAGKIIYLDSVADMVPFAHAIPDKKGLAL